MSGKNKKTEKNKDNMLRKLMWLDLKSSTLRQFVISARECEDLVNGLLCVSLK